MNLNLKQKLTWPIHRSEPNQVLVEKPHNFFVDIVIGVKDKIVDFVKGCVNHVGSIAVLAGAVTGFCYLIGELPFLALLPTWVEAPMVAPVLAAIIVWGLCKLILWQSHHQLA